MQHRPRLLSDNSPSYIAGALADWIARNGMAHIRDAPSHPQIQGKIERQHQTLKNRILLESYYFLGKSGAQVATFIEHYNHRRAHESLDNLTPADVCEREHIKRSTIQSRRLLHHQQAAQPSAQVSQTLR